MNLHGYFPCFWVLETLFCTKVHKIVQRYSFFGEVVLQIEDNSFADF